MKIKYLILAVLLFCTRISFAQDEKFMASVNENPAGTADTLEVTFALNADGEKFNPPDFDHFKVVGGPNESRSTMVINGKSTQTVSYQYRIIPMSEGEFFIGQATIMINAQQLTTELLKINVIKGRGVSAFTTDQQRALKFQERIEKTNSPTGNSVREKFVVSAEPSKTDTTGAFKLLFSIKASAGKFDAPDLKEFEIVSGPNQTESIEAINGKYSSETIIHYDLKALKDGEFLIGPASIMVNGTRITTDPIKIMIKNGVLVTK